MSPVGYKSYHSQGLQYWSIENL